MDEDGPDDLDGDGYITTMRKKVPMGQGTHKLDPKDPRLLVPVQPGELGDYLVLGSEGIDNDGDGRVNEDSVGYVDPNRTWGFSWEPTYVQAGAGSYPLSIPETRSIALWAMKHPNIAAVQSYHNNGQMILRGPGAKSDPIYPPQDLKAYDLIGKEGEKLLPGYRYFISWKDLYTVHGATTDHFYSLMGVLAFTNEMYNPPADFDKNGEVTDSRADEVQRRAHLRPRVRRLAPVQPSAVRRDRDRRLQARRRPRARGVGAGGRDAPQQRLRPPQRLSPAAPVDRRGDGQEGRATTSGRSRCRCSTTAPSRR